MKRLAAVSLVALTALAAVPDLKDLVVTALSTNEADNKIAAKIVHFHLKQRLTPQALAELRSLDLGRDTSVTNVVKITIATGQRPAKLHVILAQNGEYRNDTLALNLKPETTSITYRQTIKRDPKAKSLKIIVRDDSGNLGSLTIPTNQ